LGKHLRGVVRSGQPKKKKEIQREVRVAARSDITDSEGENWDRWEEKKGDIWEEMRKFRRCNPTKGGEGSTRKRKRGR